MGNDENFEDLARRIQRMQDRARESAQKRDRTSTLRRGFHAKGIGIRAAFQVRQDLPEHLRVGFFKPGAVYDALVRFSNAQGVVHGDLSKDQRGLAIRLKTAPLESLSPQDKSHIQDFLMTNTPVSFARTPEQFIEVGEILLGGTAGVIPRLVKKYGFQEARRILGVFLAPVISFLPLQMNQYWSRTSYQFGSYAIRYLVRPTADSAIWSMRRQLREVLRSLRQGADQREHYLREKLRDALRKGDIRFEFCIQLFVDEARTPVEKVYIEWKESDSPPIPIATLILPKQEIDSQLAREIEAMEFNPWNTDDLKPLGLINLARKRVYEASAAHRSAQINPLNLQ